MKNRIQLNETQLKQIIKEAVERALEEPEMGYGEEETLGQDDGLERVKELCERELGRFGANTTYGFLFDKIKNALAVGEISTTEELRERVERYLDWAEKNEMTAIVSAADEILKTIR